MPSFSRRKTKNTAKFIRLIDSVHKEHLIGTLLTDQYGDLGFKKFRDYVANITHCYTAVHTPTLNNLNKRFGQILTNRIRCRKNENNNNLAWTTIAH